MKTFGRTPMKAVKTLVLLFAVGVIVQVGLGVVEHRTTWKMPGFSLISLSLVSEAHAGRWGMGATPVRATGVARRTARRCANGTYNC